VVGTPGWAWRRCECGDRYRWVGLVSFALAMGVKGAVLTVAGILAVVVGVGYAIIMTFHTLLVGTAGARGSEGDSRSTVSRLYANGIAVAVGAVLVTLGLILLGVLLAGGSEGVRKRRKPVPYMHAVNFAPDPKYEVFGTAPSTALGKVLTRIDGIAYILFGVRIVGTDLLSVTRMAAAAEATPELLKIFGPQDDYREGVAAMAKDWQDGAPFNRCAGLIGFHHYIKQAMESRRSVIQYHADHPEVSKIPMVRPLLLIGLPRTGTTLLHRLLSLDPMSRTLRNWEALKPVRTRSSLAYARCHALASRVVTATCFVSAQVPPPRRETYLTDSRISSLWSTWKRVHWLCPGYFTELWKFHYFHPAEVEEETLIFPGAFLLTGMAPLGTGGHSSANYDAWYRRTDNKRGAYRYLRAVLQVLSSRYGPGTQEEQTEAFKTSSRGDVEVSPDEVGGEHVTNGRWVLKCPFHALWLDTLLQEFPDADFICTHRPADQMVPSWAKFQALTFKMLYDDESRADSREFAKVIADGFEEQLERLEQERSQQEKIGKVRATVPHVCSLNPRIILLTAAWN
jgi:hypothetical protein